MLRLFLSVDMVGSTLFKASKRAGYWSGVANVVAYSIGMALVVVSLTLALATASLRRVNCNLPLLRIFSTVPKH